jgi:hypothetical protein
MSSIIEQAVEGAIRSDLPSIRATALAWNVDRCTLSRRLNGGISLSEGHASQQLLSKMQEQMFLSWILEQERLEHAPPHQRIRKFAANIRGFSGEDPHRQELAHKVYGTKSSCSHEGWKEDRLSENPEYPTGGSGALLSSIQGLHRPV